MTLARLFLPVALSVLPLVAGVVQAADARPNIIVILVDDMGFSDIGPTGSEIPTPNLDQLAKGGALCTQFYNGARCCPTRAALITGLYAHQAGIGGMVDSGRAGKNVGIDDDSAYTAQLNHRCVTIAEALHEAGYETFQAGKWHIGAARDAWPDRRGFTRSFTLLNGASNYFGFGPQHLKTQQVMSYEFDGKAWEPPQEGFFTTDAFATHAVGFIHERSKEKPFFLYLAFNAPHWPLQESPENIAEFQGKYMEGWDKIRDRRYQRQKELLGADWVLSPPNRATKNWDGLPEDKKTEWDRRMAIYAAQVHHMDKAVGQVLATLKDEGIEQNTLVMFLSDNGACAEQVDNSKPGAEMGTRDSFTSYRQAWANVSDTPFRMFKHWIEEGGISTPFIARWPGHIAPGTRSAEVGHIIDIMPTCLEAAGAAYPKSYAGHEITPLAGVSFLPALAGKTLPPRQIFWEHEGHRAMRDGNWKIVTSVNKPWELYDIAHDRAEEHNLASSEPERVRAMAALWDAWAQRVKVEPWPQRDGKKEVEEEKAEPPAPAKGN